MVFQEKAAKGKVSVLLKNNFWTPIFSKFIIPWFLSFREFLLLFCFGVEVIYPPGSTNKSFHGKIPIFPGSFTIKNGCIFHGDLLVDPGVVDVIFFGGWRVSPGFGWPNGSTWARPQPHALHRSGGPETMLPLMLPEKTRPFPIKTRVIWVLGCYRLGGCKYCIHVFCIFSSCWWRFTPSKPHLRKNISVKCERIPFLRATILKHI